ncbi:hypothetical protein [Mesorhizobium sp. KR1-2]|uniref:hypothetical protein n=1 Tax=Mesorhizobium sp. KR1-2 TaxID=3156609 RepID=UPI0032B527AA
MSVPEYLNSENFKLRRKGNHRHRWPEHALWAVAGIAALKRAAVMAPKTASQQKMPGKKPLDTSLKSNRIR